MDYCEEQDNEIEALESIYSEELTNKVEQNNEIARKSDSEIDKIVISRKPYTFDITVKGSNEDTRDDVKIIITTTLRYTLPDKYPDVGPIIEIPEFSEQITKKRSDTLQKILEEQVKENLGMVMIFTLVSEAQDCLLQFVDDIKKENEEKRNKAYLEQQKADEIKYKGTAVTKENFIAWKIQFDEEMRLCGKRKIEISPANKRLTGRQLFESDSTLNNSDMQFMTAEEGVTVDESLFQDLNDLDLDDEDFD